MGMVALWALVLAQSITAEQATALPLEPVRVIVRLDSRDKSFALEVAAEGKDFVVYRPDYAPACMLQPGYVGKRSFTIHLPEAPGRHRLRALDRETSVVVSAPLLPADIGALDFIRRQKLYRLLSEESQYHEITDDGLSDARECITKYPSSAYVHHLQLGIAAVHLGRKQYAEAMEWGARSESLEGAWVAGQAAYLLRKPKEAKPLLLRVKDSGLLNYRTDGMLE